MVSDLRGIREGLVAVPTSRGLPSEVSRLVPRTARAALRRLWGYTDSKTCVVVRLEVIPSDSEIDRQTVSGVRQKRRLKPKCQPSRRFWQRPA